jgi:hypothetical protein
MLAQYCRLKSYRNGRMIVQTHSATVATQLRFTTPQLIDQLRKLPEFVALQSLDIKVCAAPTKTPTLALQKTRHHAPVSKRNTALLRDTADSLDSPELSESLRRLARTLDKLAR